MKKLLFILSIVGLISCTKTETVQPQKSTTTTISNDSISVSVGVNTSNFNWQDSVYVSLNNKLMKSGYLISEYYVVKSSSNDTIKIEASKYPVVINMSICGLNYIGGLPNIKWQRIISDSTIYKKANIVL